LAKVDEYQRLTNTRVDEEDGSFIAGSLERNDRIIGSHATISRVQNLSYKAGKSSRSRMKQNTKDREGSPLGG